MFHPTLGRWLQEDPIGFGAGDENLCRALGNNPVGRLDPTGQNEIPGGVTIQPVNPENFPGIGGGGFVPEGISIEFRIPGNHDVEFIQFKQVSARVRCMGFKSCDALFDDYLGGTHWHGDQRTTFSRPDKPVWEVDIGLKKPSPAYPSIPDNLPGGKESGARMIDLPQISEEGNEIFKDTIAALEKRLLQLHPAEGKVTCTVTITAKFRTYMIVDGKSVGFVSWSITTGQNPIVGGGGTGQMPDEFKDINRKRYPGYPIPK